MKYSRLEIAITILLLVSMFSSAEAANVEVLSIGPFATKTLTFNLKNGQRVSGSLSISGGSGNDIDFWITDPVGATLLNFGRVSQGRSFEFTANQDGAYTLHFGNTFSLISTKTVNLTYDVGAPLFLGVDPFLLIVIVLTALILTGAIVAIALNRRKTRHKATQPPPPPA